MSEISKLEDERNTLSALDSLVSDFEGTGDLERLEDRLCEFNLFEALGAVNAELRHSSLLAWVFNPNGSHGFGDAIVKRLLQRALIARPPAAGLTPVDLDLMDLSDLEVRREWSEIDILLTSRTNRFAVAIENKIGAAESKGQLEKYRKRVESEFNQSKNELEWHHLFIFLTIDGQQSTDENYVPMSYLQVIELLDSAINNRGKSVRADVAMTISHYIQMMRRHHMEDSDLIGLARKIYIKHRDAFDFIFDHRPDAWSDTRENLLDLLSKHPSIVIDKSTKRTVVIRFVPESWSKWKVQLSQGIGWKGQESDQFLLCEIRPDTKRERARLQVVLGPGPKEIREAIILQIRQAGIYKYAHSPQWTTVLTKAWRQLQNEDGLSNPEQNAKTILNDINEFLANESMNILTALDKAFGSSAITQLNA